MKRRIHKKRQKRLGKDEGTVEKSRALGAKETGLPHDEAWMHGALEAAVQLLPDFGDPRIIGNALEAIAKAKPRRRQ